MINRYTFLIWGLLLLGPAEADNSPPPSGADLDSVSTDDLITKLQDESNIAIVDEGIFMPVDYEPDLFRRIMGYTLRPVPVISPVMRELVRRGTASLPLLIDHLADSRPTQLFEHRAIGRWFGNEYDPRNRNSDKLPPGVGSLGSCSGGKDEKTFDSYNLKVGDLCYVAVEQIVNRNLWLIRGQPTACEVVNSPVLAPALAEAVKTDWSGLTSTAHQDSLEHDGALQKLLFYYPAAGTAIALKRIHGTLYDYTVVLRLIDRTFFTPEANEASLEKKLAKFRKENGELAYRGFESQLIIMRNSKYDKSPNAQHQKALVDQLLARLFPEVDPLHPPDLGLSEFGGDSETLAAIGNFTSADIDHAVYDLLKRVTVAPAPDKSVDSDDAKFECWQYKLCRFELACRCAWRLTPPGEREALLRSCQELRLKYPEPNAGLGAQKTFDLHFEKFLQDQLSKLASK